jgi:GTP-binding protein HflX
MIEVWNKWDLLSAEQSAHLWHTAREAAHDDEVVVPLSAVTGEGCELLGTANRLLTGDAREHRFTIPVHDGARIAWLYAHGEVLADEDAGAKNPRVWCR